MVTDHDFWRIQLLDELRRKLVAFEYEPQLDPTGSRRSELEHLISRLELAEISAASGRD